MSQFLLDTDTVSYYLRNDGRVREHVERFTREVLAVSSITVAELTFGAARRRSSRLAATIGRFLDEITVLPFDARAAEHFGHIAADLEARGIPIGKFDLLIAAHALSLPATLVTNNTRHFSRIVDLEIANWF